MDQRQRPHSAVCRLKQKNLNWPLAPWGAKGSGARRRRQAQEFGTERPAVYLGTLTGLHWEAEENVWRQWKFLPKKGSTSSSIPFHSAKPIPCVTYMGLGGVFLPQFADLQVSPAEMHPGFTDLLVSP